MVEKRPTTVELEFEIGVDVYDGGDPGRTVLANSGWVQVDYSDGATVWYPPQAFKRLIRRPVDEELS
jgi:hypothetical protein